jgi:transcriptional regulator with PAS, ATPase and Fis domain
MRENPEIIGSSPAICELRRTIGRLASLDVTTLIQGPSGSGKELVAKSLHRQSDRANGPWVAINCAAIPSELCESLLFGHLKGSFTGADRAAQGLISQAHGGTLFLDEIGELPLALQSKLLRVLEERRLRPLGDSQEHPIDVRLISASHRPLHDLVEKGLFRPDLYFRIHLAVIQTPTLTELGDDLQTLAEFFVHEAARLHGLKPKPLSPEAITALFAHHFSGNVRELNHVMTAALIWSSGDAIEPADLPLRSMRQSSTHHHVKSAHTSTTLHQILLETEKAVIRQALSHHHGDRFAAANELGISERSLRYRLKKHPQLLPRKSSMSHPKKTE